MIQNRWLLLLKREIAYGGGAERRLIRLYDLLNDRSANNIKYNLITYLENINFVKENSNNLKIYSIDSSQPKIKTFFSLFWLINKNVKKNDAFQISNTSFFNIFLTILLKLKKVVVITSINSYGITQKRIDLIHQKISYLQFLLSDKIDWLYSYYGKYWKNNFILKKSVQTPCSFTNYQLLNCNIEKKENIILFSARMTEMKQPLLILKSIKIIKKDIRKNKYKIIFLGGGPLSNKCKIFVKENNLEDIVCFHQTIDPSNYFKKSKIFLSIQKYENYPSQSLLEAIASENLIISTNVGETKKIINNKYSILINNSEKDLSNAIIKAMREYNIYKRHLKDLKNKTMRNHNIERVGKFYINEIFTKNKKDR